MSETVPEHSPVAEQAANAVDSAIQEQQTSALAVDAAVTAESAGEAAETAQSTAEVAADLAVSADEKAETAQEVGEVSAETSATAAQIADAAGQEAWNAREDIAALRAEIERQFTRLHERIPERESVPEVAEVTVSGSAERATREDDTTRESPNTAGTERRKRHGFGR